MRRVIRICLLSLMGVSVLSGGAYASTGSNSGLTGLWEYPTAEIPDDGAGRFGYSRSSPYEYYFLDFTWLPWLEVNGRLSRFVNIYSTRYDRYYMDRAVDFKAILWHNRNSNQWYIPSIAFGMTDASGTELMKSYFWAATWRWGDFAATIGYGSDRLNGMFYGLEWDIADWLTFKAEYGDLDYNKDRAEGRRVLDKLPSEKYNFGLVFKVPWGLEGSVSYQRGDEVAFTLSQTINLNGPFFRNTRKRYKLPGEQRIPEWKDIDAEELLSRIKSGLEKYTRIRDIDIKLEDLEDNTHRLSLAYENYGYSSHAEAMTRVLVVLSAVMPETDELVLIQKNAGIPIIKASFPGSLLFDIRAHTLRDEEEPMQGAVFEWADSGLEEADEEHYLKKKAQHELKAMLVYEPRIAQTMWDDYYHRFDIDAIYKGRYSNGWSAIFDVRFPIYNNIDISDRKGLWWEKDLNDEIRIQAAGLMYANSFTSDGRGWFFGEGGYLDEEWFGANLWLRYYDKSGRWWVGGRMSELHDRDPYSFGGLTDGKLRYQYGRIYDREDEDEWRFAAWFQAGYYAGIFDLDIQADYGQYADGDRGYKISLIRHWDDTAIGFWYMNTDKKPPDKDFTKMGIHMEIPADKWFGSWFGNSSSHVWEQDTILMSSWRIESGRDEGKIRTPERMMSQLRPVSMKKNVERLLADYCAYDEEDVRDFEDKQEIRSILDYIIH